MPLKIEDYALIGNLQTAGLVGKNGSIDWLCLPRFDSGACFAELLGTSRNGSWRISPVQPARVKRRYRRNTMVLETHFETDTGSVRLTDCMIPEKQGADLIRLVEGVSGRVELEMEFVPRFDYGSQVPWVQYQEHEVRATAGPDTVHLYGGVRLSGDNYRTKALFGVSAGEVVSFVLNWHPSHESPSPKISDPWKAVEDTTQWWRDWSSRSRYRGGWKDAVHRSLLVLKSLTYQPTGGIVAAPTTSLPERVGSIRNWDYRYCWLRDSTFTLYSLTVAGYVEEAQAWREWLLRAIAGKPSDMSIMYSITGRRRLPELTLDWLPGYLGSRPVRIGNDAHRQFQLDVYGEVMDSLHLARRMKIDPLEGAWAIQKEIIAYLETVWEQPDEGIWEVRGQKRHFTHSKVMAWVALDRAVKAVERFGMEGPVAQWRDVRDRIHREVCDQGYNRKLGSFTQYYGSDGLDASLLLIPQVGFLPPVDPRVRRTTEAIERNLMKDGFVMRYSTEQDEVDGLPPGEGAFIACSFWLVDNLTLIGRIEDARRLFERLLSVRNDVGLLAEEYDPRLRRQVGNFPQAFSHVALLNSARNLSECHGPAQDRRGGHEHTNMTKMAKLTRRSA